MTVGITILPESSFVYHALTGVVEMSQRDASGNLHTLSSSEVSWVVPVVR